MLSRLNRKNELNEFRYRDKYNFGKGHRLLYTHAEPRAKRSLTIITIEPLQITHKNDTL